MVSYSWSSMLFGEIVGSLNPCCNGRWSRTELNKIRKTAGLSVLILVVMEDGLVLTINKMKENIVKKS